MTVLLGVLECACDVTLKHCNRIFWQLHPVCVFSAAGFFCSLIGFISSFAHYRTLHYCTLEQCGVEWEGWMGEVGG